MEYIAPRKIRLSRHLPCKHNLHKFSCKYFFLQFFFLKKISAITRHNIRFVLLSTISHHNNIFYTMLFIYACLCYFGYLFMSKNSQCRCCSHLELGSAIAA